MPHTLITGANSFVAAHVINELIANGHTVTGTVRRTSAGEALLKLHPEWEGKLDFETVEDYAKEGAFDEIFKKQDIDYIVHTAAPLLDDPANTDYDKHFLEPSVGANLSLFKSAVALAPKLKSIAITGSINAMTMGTAEENAAAEYTNESWGSFTQDDARKAQNAYVSYCSSKKEAELAVWDFVKKENPKFAVTVFLPALIFGPPIQAVSSVKKLNFSTNVVYSMFNGTQEEIPNTHAGMFPSYIDARDLAYAHVKALTTPAAANKRFLVGGEPLTATKIVKTLEGLAETSLPELKGRFPKDTGKDTNITYPRIRAEEGNEVLGMKLRTAEETFGDLARKVLELEKAEK
ncbi:NAD(P)-binding protein [Amniculicola lignicola CBS 123094]|uniref:NAD(P)-binding protein n=1 Tax=Amniculicola lignicola CBS 123094 TaxID=1392246 RepID=A0A6A5WBX7_9PLEO|nr:NAD(P)-binding protein [Amniculicola lignicola CBS 123094]